MLANEKERSSSPWIARQNNPKQNKTKHKPSISEESSFSELASLETCLVGNFNHLIKQVIETLMISNLLKLVFSWGLLYHLNLQDLYLPAWLVSTKHKEKQAFFWESYANLLHFSKTVDLKHCLKYTFFFPLWSWKQPSQALDSREAEDTVALLSFYSCVSLQPGITCKLAHGFFCLSTAHGLR